MRHVPPAALLLAVAGCATVNSGIRPAGAPGTYTLTERDSPVNGGARTAERDAMAQAQAFCQARGAQFVPGTAQTLARPVQQSLVGATGFTLTFRCRDPNSPDDAPGPEFGAGP